MALEVGSADERRPVSKPATAPLDSCQVSRRSDSGMFASFRVRNFRLYATGLGISQTGTWVQRLSQSWLVHTMTGSASAVGVTVALQFLPTLLLGPYGGVLADRLPKRRLMLITQSVMGLTCTVLALLTISGQVQVWNVWATALVLGLVSVVDAPSTQSFIGEIVGPDRLANAVGLNSATRQCTRLLGPAVAGVLLTTVGTGYAFLINGISYTALIGALLLIRDSQLYLPERPPQGKGQLREGLRYVASRPELIRSIALVGFLGTFGFNLPVWLPEFAGNVFHRNGESYNLLYCLLAAGGVVSAVLALRWREAGRKLIFGTAVLFGVLLALASYAPEFWLFAALMVPIGGMAALFTTTACTSVQLATDTEMRGRVMALFMMVLTGGTPIGAPLVGWVTDSYGPRFGMFTGGALSVLAAATVWWALSPAGRRQLGACR
ncbi:MFS transporter, partial [Streptomyces sp. NPDC055709]